MNYVVAVLSQIIFAGIVGVYMGPVPTLLVELFPTRVRFTGVAISYNLSAAIFGGTAPMVGAFLHKIYWSTNFSSLLLKWSSVILFMHAVFL